MHIFDQLIHNKGTVSSALGKELALEYLNGRSEILPQAVELVVYDLENIKSKSVRAGAAKILEKIAETKPEVLLPFAEDLLPALRAQEPQTRWMVIRLLGFLASQSPDVAERAFSYADSFLVEKAGVCLSGSASEFLGYYGAMGGDNARKAFTALVDYLPQALPNEVDWILEAFLRMGTELSVKEKEKILHLIEQIKGPLKKATEKRLVKIKKRFNQ